MFSLRILIEMFSFSVSVYELMNNKVKNEKCNVVGQVKKVQNAIEIVCYSAKTMEFS